VTRDRQFGATVAGLAGIGPKDELEGMIAGQLIAAHNAAMECYRRAMIGEQTFEGRRENLNQANKLSRTWATLLDALGSALVACGYIVVGAAENGRGAVALAREQRLDLAVLDSSMPVMGGLDAARQIIGAPRRRSASSCLTGGVEEWVLHEALHRGAWLRRQNPGSRTCSRPSATSAAARSTSAPVFAHCGEGVRRK
jgi:CheY-like chemotaxis protein